MRGVEGRYIYICIYVYVHMGYFNQYWRMTWKIYMETGIMQGSTRNFGLPKVRGAILGIPIARLTVFWPLYWGPLTNGPYMCIYIYICIYTCTQTCNIHTSICIHACLHVCITTCI